MSYDKPDEKKNGFNISLNLDRWLPYILIAGGWLINFGRGASSTDALNNQVKTDEALIQELNKNMQSLNVQIAQLETTIEDMRREANQDRIYKESTSKK